MSLDFYDSKGNSIAYSDDGVHIYTFAGKPVAYIHDGSVYSFKGRHLGRFSNGVIRDNGGHTALFSSGSTGGPLKPMCKLQPLKGLKQLQPLKGLRQLPPLRPLDSLSWSKLSGPQFFG